MSAAVTDPTKAAAGLLRPLLETYAASTPVRRIAVVGNAPLEPSRERQQRIDSSDLVVRCNSFVLDKPGDEPCLGTRTNVAVLARATRITPFTFEDYRSRAYLVVDAGNLRVVPPPGIPQSWPADLGCWPIPNEGIGIPLKRLISPETEGLGAVPTTGTLAAYLALALFPEAETAVTGFSFLHDRTQKTWKHHVGGEVPVHKAHLIDREGALLQSYVDAGALRYLP